MQNVDMRVIRALLEQSLVRYGAAGATVGLVYLVTPLVLNELVGVPLEVAILLGYVLAVTLHFNLQRHFVFRHVDEFALSAHQQIVRYLAIGAVQYPITALATGFLPELLGVSQRVIFVLVTLLISAASFLLLRGHVFHPNAEEEPIAEAPAGNGSVRERRRQNVRPTSATARSCPELDDDTSAQGGYEQPTNVGERSGGMFARVRRG